jgi:hypothetical protein
MTPAKEKAQELFKKYATYAAMWTGGFEVQRENCKQCALIAVDEIENQILEILDNEISGIHAIYWEQVKKEIKNM